MYILLDKGKVREIIPDIAPMFPGIPIEARYTAEFVASLLHVEEGTKVQQNWIYDPETETFSAPPKPEPKPEPEMISTSELDAEYQEGVNSYV